MNKQPTIKSNKVTGLIILACPLEVHLILKEAETQEYLRRNLIVAKAYGARAAIENAIKTQSNLRGRKRLVARLTEAFEKLEPVIAELRAHQSEIWENPLEGKR